ncbi:MAG: hypothetical protein ABSF88_09070 [Candidatus Aminicenantales bacterium]
MKKHIKSKANPKDEKIKQEIKEIRSDLKRLKKSKKRMQLLWYRTKKEHVALIKDLDLRLKALRKGTSAKRTTRAKRVVVRAIGKKNRAKKSILEPMRKKAPEKKQIKEKIIKKTRKNITPAKKK